VTTRITVTSGVLGIIALSVAALAAPQVRPGEPTKAEVWVRNRGPREAIPIVIEQPQAATPLRTQVVGPVQLAGTVPVTVAPANIVTIRRSSQSWEYETVTVREAQAADTALASYGRDGWEAVDVTSSAGGVVILLKRPR
jgi:hypothetical protein